MRSRRSRGVTMVEIIITLAIVAILAVIAVPSFTGTIQRARTQSEANSLVNDLQFARSEAIKRGLPVSLCASSDGATCTNANAWDRGWIVFNDDNGSGAIDTSTDKVLRARAPFTSSDTFTATTTSTTKSLTYSRDGFAMNLPNNGAFKVTLSTTSPANATATRCVSVNMVGRAVHTGGACS
ncbi:GspH/FimT family pseudopilin [Ralstonia sp. 24A2]|uniref:GspH/FimT family pseudopilin n=1 Tax=Ralstonia sp. 24A2 TaxID=3447364 RepID=UPI003F6A3BAC